MLHYWLYLSKAETPPRAIDNALIYLQSRNRNARHGITGYLHRESGHYLQYAEGPADEVAQLKELIRRDWRHTHIRTVARGRVVSRRFERWDMTFEGDVITFHQVQSRRGAETDITRASAADLLAYLESIGQGDQANSVSTG